MEIKGKVHCFFEQSETLKNEFNELGIPAEDYDIQNNLGEKVKKMSEIDPNEETTEKISALEKVTKAELNKCNTIEDKMEWLGKVLGQAIFENNMNYAVWVNVQKNNIIEQLKKENEQLKAYESHWKEIEEDVKVIAKENAELKEKLDKIRNYLVYDIFDRFKYFENLLKISQETQEELSKRILEQQKTIGSTIKNWIDRL